MTGWRSLALSVCMFLQACGSADTMPGAGGETTASEKSETHVFEQLAPGIYFATATGAVNLGSNAMVVVNQDDVLVVDLSHHPGRCP